MIMIKNKTHRKIIRWAVPFAAIPLLALIGAVTFEEKRNILLSMAAAFLALILFASGFEKKSTGTRRIVIVSVMTALCFAGRFIPILKPINALIIITALYIGSEAGFLVGALSAVLTNFYFGQGPWTVFQMLAWGMIGYIAGILADSLRKNRKFLLFYGTITGIFYSCIMDVWTVLWYAGSLNLKLYVSALVTAIPYMLSYIASNLIFLSLLAKPFGQKLERIKIKYGV